MDKKRLSIYVILSKTHFAKSQNYTLNAAADQKRILLRNQ